MRLNLRQRKKAIILVVVFVILLLISAFLCYFFMPRSLTRIVPMEGISSVYYEYDDLDKENQVLLTVEEQQELMDDLSTIKYRPKYGTSDKSAPYVLLCVSYHDGTIIKIDGRRIEKKKDGISIIYRISLICNDNLFKFFPDVV